MKIAYIVYSGAVKYLPANNFNEIEDLLPFLQHKGLNITAEIWDNPAVDWKKYDVMLLKTPWDYHEKYTQFITWLDKTESLGIKMFNDFHLVRWNMDKHYLETIAGTGLPVIPSIFLNKGWNGELSSLFKKLQATKLIIKPCISGGSKNTIVIYSNTIADQADNILSLLSQGDFIAQPLMPQIEEGEWSFIFFNGRHSHTVIKKPKAGDFRVQQIYGGTIVPVNPGQALIKSAEAYVQQFAGDALYARVDGIMVNGHFILMELELIEPFLYLSYGNGAVENYYTALIAKLKK
ncbi:MAG: hypothetical protein QM768_03535 [Agriterribacter sp.]